MIRILAVGKLKDRSIGEMVGRYLERARPWARVEVTELKDSGTEREGREILRWLDSNPAGRVVACDEAGEQTTSRGLSRMLGAHGSLTFVIGGPDGLAAEVKARADEVLSLSRLTLTHEMARLLLSEQIYRGLAILRGHGYHRD